MMSIGTYYKDNVLQETYSIHRYADLQKKQMEKNSERYWLITHIAQEN